MKEPFQEKGNLILSPDIVPAKPVIARYKKGCNTCKIKFVYATICFSKAPNSSSMAKSNLYKGIERFRLA